MTCLTCDRKLWSFERERGTCGRCAQRRGNARRASLISAARKRIEHRRAMDAGRELVARAQADVAEAAAVLARRDRYRSTPVEAPVREDVAVPSHGRDASAWLWGSK